MSRIDDVVTTIFADVDQPLAVECTAWLASSPRFLAFAERYATKLRKKVRNVGDAEASRDLHCELATAFWLVQERKFAVDYEQQGLGKQRGPDFSIMFKTRLAFNVEVKRLRSASAEPPTAKLITTLCDKLGQLPPSTINLICLVADEPRFDLAQTMKWIKQHADQRDDMLFRKRGLLDARDFLRQYPRLSGLILRPAPYVGALPTVLWRNPQARHPLTPELATVLQRL